MVWIEPNEAGFRKMLNQQGVQQYLKHRAQVAESIYRVTTKRSPYPKTHNADQVKVEEVDTYRGIRGDRPEASVTAFSEYALQREEGGTRNAFPEHSLKAAIGKAAATGGGGPSGRAAKLDRRYMSGTYTNRRSANEEADKGFISSRYLDRQRERRIAIRQSASAIKLSNRYYGGDGYYAGGNR